MAATDNTMKAYNALDLEMHLLHEKGDDKNRDKAEEIAKLLISYADLPLKHRCRALMILGCSDHAGYLEWAEEAVRVAQLAFDNTTEEPTVGALALMESCKRVRDRALKAFEEDGGYWDSDGEEEEEEEEDDDVKGEEAASADEKKDEVVAPSQEEADPTTEMAEATESADQVSELRDVLHRSPEGQ